MAYKIKAGNYYIGDPCYVMATEVWSELCDQFGDDNTLAKPGMVLLPTAYGDGEYRDNSDRLYFVDSGTIGAVRLGDHIDDMDILSLITVNEDYAYIIKFVKDFTISSKDGVLKFGRLTIDTNGEEEEEEDEYEEYEWEGEDENEFGDF